MHRHSRIHKKDAAGHESPLSRPLSDSSSPDLIQQESELVKLGPPARLPMRHDATPPLSMMPSHGPSPGPPMAMMPAMAAMMGPGAYMQPPPRHPLHPYGFQVK